MKKNEEKKGRIAEVDAKVEELQNQDIYSINLWHKYELAQKYSQHAQL